VFETAADPVSLALVTSLNRPVGNVTGITQLSAVTVSKRLELLHELFPQARAVALLVNPNNSVIAESATNEMSAAAKSLVSNCSGCSPCRERADTLTVLFFFTFFER